MKMSDEGRKRLTAREGVRLKAYRDSVGVLTIGIGHTSAAGPPEVVPGLTISATECDAIFKRDLVQYENAVNQAVKVQLQQNQFDACVSLCYNIGTGGFARSTVARKINAGDMAGAADAFLMWNRPPDIIGRRRTEVAQFKTPYADAPAIPPPPDIPKPIPTAPKPAPAASGGWLAAILNLFRRKA